MIPTTSYFKQSLIAIKGKLKTQLHLCFASLQLENSGKVSTEIPPSCQLCLFFGKWNTSFWVTTSPEALTANINIVIITHSLNFVKHYCCKEQWTVTHIQKKKVIYNRDWFDCTLKGQRQQGLVPSHEKVTLVPLFLGLI